MKPDAKLAGGILAVWLAAIPAPACGPHFPNSFLADESAVLTAPSARFYQEIERMKLTPPIHRRVTSEKGFASEAADADIAELRAALEKAGVASSACQAVVEAHRAEREKLRVLADYNTNVRDMAGRELLRELPPPPSKRIAVASGLPGEFADYFRGAIAWHSGDEVAAIAAWRALLERPAAERHFRSVWAAFMIGKAHLKREPQKAVGYFQQTRQFARAGFADSIGLGASSLGWEAKVHSAGVLGAGHRVVSETRHHGRRDGHRVAALGGGGGVQEGRETARGAGGASEGAPRDDGLPACQRRDVAKLR